jgi:hypothetical protein
MENGSSRIGLGLWRGSLDGCRGSDQSLLRGLTLRCHWTENYGKQKQPKSATHAQELFEAFNGIKRESDFHVFLDALITTPHWARQVPDSVDYFAQLGQISAQFRCLVCHFSAIFTYGNPNARTYRCMGATSDWTVPNAEFPLNAGADEKLGFAVKYAQLASEQIFWPSWNYRILDSVAELIATEAPLAHVLDDGRETVIGCGVSLQLFKLTLRHLRCLGRVELFPDLDHPLLAARIHFGHGGERDSTESRLYDVSGPGFHTPLLDELLPFDSTARLFESAAQQERGWLEYARNETTRERLHTLAIRPQRLVVEEVRFTNRDSATLPAHERKSTRMTSISIFKRLSRWKKPQLVVKVGSSPVPSPGPEENSPTAALPGTLAVLKTKTDDRYGWLAAGQAIARVILQARASGVSCILHNESLRSPHVRSALRTEIGRKGFVQAILRFGFGCQPTSIEPMLPLQPTHSIDQPAPLRTTVS